MRRIFNTFIKDGSVDFRGGFRENAAFFLCWVVGLIALSVLIFLIVRRVNRKKNPEGADAGTVRVFKKSFFDTRTMVFGALCLGLAFILSFIKLWEMPQGGAITLASSLPVILFAYIYGWKYGFTVAFTFSLLQMIQSPAYVMNFRQALLDYVVAFTVLGVAGFFRKHLFAGTVAAYGLRFLAHSAAGLIWYRAYNATAFNGTAYCFLYNLVFLLPELLICLALLAVPAVRRLIGEMQRKALR